MLFKTFASLATSAALLSPGFSLIPSTFWSLSPSLARASSVVVSATGEIDSSSTMDSEYPGTAVERMLAIRERVKSLTPDQLNADWKEARRSILWAGGLRDLESAVPGEGYTGHSFNDFNHCDLTAMAGDFAHNENEGRVSGIQFSNKLGRGIELASLPELGPGGSWSTCMMGCNSEPP